MRQLMGMERRLQDIERALQNMERNGEIVDVKFDTDKRRWFVKINDGEDKTPSGQDSQGAGAQDTFKSDWLPWKSFSHGSISFSLPPRKGMKASLRSPMGQPELAVAEPFSYGPDTPSPHDKEDEIVMQVKAPGDDSADTTLKFHFSKDSATVTLGKTTFRITKDRVEVTTENVEVTAKDAKVKADKVLVDSPDVNLGGDGGKPVARVGDMVSVSFGSSAGMHPIVQGSGAVKAVD